MAGRTPRGPPALADSAGGMSGSNAVCQAPPSTSRKGLWHKALLTVSWALKRCPQPLVLPPRGGGVGPCIAVAQAPLSPPVPCLRSAAHGRAGGVARGGGSRLLLEDPPRRGGGGAGGCLGPWPAPADPPTHIRKIVLRQKNEIYQRGRRFEADLGTQTFLLASAPPKCGIPWGCCSFTGPWTVTRSSLRMLRRVAAFCRPLRPVLLLVSFPRSRSPVIGVPGLCWMWRDGPFARRRCPIIGVLGVVLVVVGVV